jgi:type VI secretion system protein ImpH
MTSTSWASPGPSGVLPYNYTELVIDRLRNKDRALAEFLDIFHHRMISLFYQAWEKYRFPWPTSATARTAFRAT